MKAIKFLNYFFVVVLGFFAVMYGIDRFSDSNATIAYETHIFTAEYCQGDDFVGFNDVIPLEIVMNEGKIDSINILDNKETPRFLQKVKDAGLVDMFRGLTPREAVNLDIDAVSGATYSSNAIIKSVKTSMEILDDALNPNPWTWQLFGIIVSAVILCLLSLFGKALTAKKYN